MTDFKREERYIVVKIKDIGATRLGALRQFLAAKEIPTRECVVVEPDWPIYEIVWHLVERLATGQRLPFMTDDDPDELKTERDALAAALRDIRTAAAIFAPSFSREIERRTADPAALLARLKAEWQVDRTEQIREMCEGLTGSQIRSALDGLLAGLRRQAKGGE